MTDDNVKSQWSVRKFSQPLAHSVNNLVRNAWAATQTDVLVLDGVQKRINAKAEVLVVQLALQQNAKKQRVAEIVLQ